MHRFADILRAWLGNLTTAEAAVRLHMSRRNLQYLLSGRTLPQGPTLALIERQVAAGAGITVGELRAVVERERRGRHGAAPSADGCNAPADIAEPVTGATR